RVVSSDADDLHSGDFVVVGWGRASELRRHGTARPAVPADDRADEARREPWVRVRVDLRLARALAGVDADARPRRRPDVEDQARPHGHEPGHTRADRARE